MMLHSCFKEAVGGGKKISLTKSVVVTNIEMGREGKRRRREEEETPREKIFHPQKTCSNVAAFVRDAAVYFFLGKRQFLE